MDRLAKRWDSTRDEDLRLCPLHGLAYQKDMNRKIVYDANYAAHYKALEGSRIADALNAGRCAMLARHAPEGATVIDIGAGCGTFVKAARSWGFAAKGFDVIAETVNYLKGLDAFAPSPEDFDVVTFWDSIEHIDVPEILFRDIKKGAIVLVAIPVFEDVTKVRESKHYKPGEHLYYWTAKGFIDWMALYGFRMLETSTHEVDAGRESIGAFAFKRDLPDYDDHILAYQEMHFSRFYGSSATELHLKTVSEVVKELQPKSILDFGCGRSDLVAHFWRDGERRIERYDPAIPPLRRTPRGRFDLVLCCDVLEHIPLASVDRVLADIKAKGNTVLFTISTKLARAKLPDGRNAHVTLLTRKEWRRWLSDVFGDVRELPYHLDHELIMLAAPK